MAVISQYFLLLSIIFNSFHGLRLRWWALLSQFKNTSSIDFFQPLLSHMDHYSIKNTLLAFFLSLEKHKDEIENN
jgi:hypothetical protein